MHDSNNLTEENRTVVQTICINQFLKARLSKSLS